MRGAQRQDPPRATNSDMTNQTIDPQTLEVNLPGPTRAGAGGPQPVQRHSSAGS